MPTGGSGVIAMVDACDAPNIDTDLNTFYTQFYQPQGYALPKFKKIQVGTPCKDTGWAEEETLDVEWAYAMAPNATIVLVEATDASGGALMAAEDVAAKMVANNAAKRLVPIIIIGLHLAMARFRIAGALPNFRRDCIRQSFLLG